MEESVLLQTRTRKIYLPSKGWVVIREQNGEDDEIISNPEAAAEGMSVNNLVAAVITSASFKVGRVTPEDVLAMRLRDKYCILLASRIFSLGATLKFEHSWPSKDKNSKPLKVVYEENLEKYLVDYQTVPEDFDFLQENVILPYRVAEPDRILQLSSGKVVRWDFSDGYSEKYLIELPIKEKSKNSELRARRLSLKVGEEFQEVESFRNFSTRDMQEIRADIDFYDASPELTSDVTNPETKEVDYINILANVDFFFPRII